MHGKYWLINIIIKFIAIVFEDAMVIEVWQPIWHKIFFLKLVTSINTFRYSGKFYNYLFTIAVNTCNNYCTKKSLNQTELNDSVFSTDVEKSMIDNIIENENSIIIQKALDTLPDMQREAIILKYYHDFKVKDIAKTTGGECSYSSITYSTRIKKNWVNYWTERSF